jgi:hypothetical protein
MIHSASLRKYTTQAQKVSSKPRNRFIMCSMSGKEPVLIQSHAQQTCATKWLPMQGIDSPYFLSTLHDCDLVHIFQGHLTEVGFPTLVTYTGFVPRWVSVCLQRSLEEQKGFLYCLHSLRNQCRVILLMCFEVPGWSKSCPTLFICKGLFSIVNSFM